MLRDGSMRRIDPAVVLLIQLFLLGLGCAGTRGLPDSVVSDAALVSSRAGAIEMKVDEDGNILEVEFPVGKDVVPRSVLQVVQSEVGTDASAHPGQRGA